MEPAVPDHIRPGDIIRRRGVAGLRGLYHFGIWIGPNGYTANPANVIIHFDCEQKPDGLARIAWATCMMFAGGQDEVRSLCEHSLAGKRCTAVTARSTSTSDFKVEQYRPAFL